jgi:hypothetical protein
MPDNMSEEASLKFKLLIDNCDVAIERDSDDCFLITHHKQQCAIWITPYAGSSQKKWEVTMIFITGLSQRSLKKYLLH